jgi:zinc protease
MQNKLDRTIIPENKDLPCYNFPDFDINTHSSGIKVYTAENNTHPLVNFKVIFKHGAAHDKIPGLAHFCSLMMTRGSSNRTAEEIDSQTDYIGAILSGGAAWDSTAMHVLAMSEFIEEGISILSDCVMNPVFADDEIARLKKKQISSIDLQLSDIDYLGNLALYASLFESTPYGHSLQGTKDSVSLINRDDCVEFHNTMMQESEISIIVSGNMSKDRVFELIDKYFDFSSNKVSKDPGFSVQSINKNSITLIQKADSSQTALRIAKIVVDRLHPDYMPVQMLNTVLSGYFMSRLNELLREKYGYTYGVHSNIQGRRHSSAFIMSAALKKDATKHSIEVIFDEMNKISAVPLSEEECYTAKRYVLGSFLRTTETADQMSSMLHVINQFNLPNDYFSRFYKSFSELTPADLIEAQAKYFRPENMIIAAAGDLDYIASELRSYGDINICDSNGRLSNYNSSKK